MEKLHPIEKLTSIQYGAIMQAINNAKIEIAEDTFIDPYAENEDNWTNEDVLEALNEVENIIISANIPF